MVMEAEPEGAPMEGAGVQSEMGQAVPTGKCPLCSRQLAPLRRRWKPMSCEAM